MTSMIFCLWRPCKVRTTPQPHVFWGQTITSPLLKLSLPISQRFTVHRWEIQSKTGPFRYSPFIHGSWVPFLKQSTFPGWCIHSREHLAMSSKIAWVGTSTIPETTLLTPSLFPQREEKHLSLFCFHIVQNILPVVWSWRLWISKLCKTIAWQVFKPPPCVITADSRKQNPAEGTTLECKLEGKEVNMYLLGNLQCLHQDFRELFLRSVDHTSKETVTFYWKSEQNYCTFSLYAPNSEAAMTRGSLCSMLQVCHRDQTPGATGTCCALQALITCCYWLTLDIRWKYHTTAHPKLHPLFHGNRHLWLAVCVIYAP